MAWQTVNYRLSSSAPLIMHNGQTADPLNKWSKLLKQITSKRKMTDADLEEKAHIQFLASLYIDETGPILPTKVIDALVVNAAKKSREGPTAKSAVFCLQHARLEYDGPRTAAELWADERFHFAVTVRIGPSRVPSMRAVFNVWAATISLNLEDTLVNPARVDEWMAVAGVQVGLCDWRPQNGRFTAERVIELSKERLRPELALAGDGRR